MAMLWYPGQDVDFLGRLDRIEKMLNRSNITPDLTTPYSVDELEAENKELRMRIDDLEEIVLTLSEEVGRLESRIPSFQLGV